MDFQILEFRSSDFVRLPKEKGFRMGRRAGAGSIVPARRRGYSATAYVGRGSCRRRKPCAGQRAPALGLARAVGLRFAALSPPSAHWPRLVGANASLESPAK